MPRLFISHSSKNNVVAVAFKQWLGSNGWAGEDIFLDLDDVGAGERWKEALHKANARCEAVILLASPHSLASPECLAEVRKAEDFGKEIIVVLLNDVELDDRRLDSYKDRQIVQLAAEPQAHTEHITHRGESYDVGFNADALAKIKDYLIKRGIAPEHFAWPPRDRPNAEPFPGLAAFMEDDAGTFFGRDSDILRGLDKLRVLRRNRHPRLLVIQAASGAGKSSFLRAGLWPRLKRDPGFAPLAILRPAQGILTGPDGLGHKLAPQLARPAAPVNPGDIHAALAADDLAKAAAAFLGLMTSAAKQAHEARRVGERTARPPALVLAVDQAEELFAAEDAAESGRFLGLLGDLLRDAADTLELFVLATIRADSADQLLQALAARGAEVSETLPLLPLPATSYRDVILKPIELLARRGQRIIVEPALADRLAADATGADALPLLSFTLARLYRDFHARGSLTLAQYETMGGVGGSIDKALKDALAGAGTVGTDANLRRLIVPGLATWDPVASAAKRLVALEAEVAGGGRAAQAPLADALVEARLLTRDRKTLEVAHEALLRREPIAGWLEARKDALRLRDDVLREAEEWAAAGQQERDLVRRGPRLEAALALQADPDFASALSSAKAYLAACQRQETAGQRRARRIRAAIYAALLAAIAASQYAIFKEPIDAFVHWNTTVRWYIAETIAPHLLSPEREQALKPGETFRECTKACPDMVVVPAGTFVMGSPDGRTPIVGVDGKPKDGPVAPAEKGRDDDEGPQHEVKVATFAAGRREVTFDDYEECVRLKGCAPVSDSGWGKGRRPVVNISWDEAKQYVDWLARVTGKPYRLLTEAEWEHAARAGTTTAYSFGDDERELCKHANLADRSLKRRAPTYTTVDFCDDGHVVPAPVGSYPTNAFGLHDMHGNVLEWTEDCYVNSYRDAPGDGAARRSDDCKLRVARGGSWIDGPQILRAADRGRYIPDFRGVALGFRVGRSLLPPRTQ